MNVAGQIKESIEKIPNEKMAQIKVDSEQIIDIIGSNAKKITASSSGKIYEMRPAPMSKMGEVSSKIHEIELMFTEASKTGENDYEALSKDNNKLLKLMASIIRYGIGEDKISIEQILNEFTVGDFPKCFEAVLDMNDFFVGMRNIYQKRMKVT